MAAPLWSKLLIPTTGGLIVGIIISFIARLTKGHGVPEVIEAYNREIFKLDMASGLANSLRLQQKMHSQRVSLGGGFQLLEVVAVSALVGKTLEALKLREHFGATVLTIKRKATDKENEVSYIIPTASTVIQAADVLIVFGLHKDLSRFPHA